MIGAVGLMAVKTTVTNRRMLPDEGASFFGVALITDLVDMILFEQRVIDRSMWIVAIDAG